MGSSGYSRKKQLKLPPVVVPGGSENLTFSDLQRYMSAIQEWADSLQFGFIGFNVNAGVSGFTNIAIGSTVVPFTKVVSDSNDFTKTDNQESRYFTVPSGCGGMYTISWSVAVSGNRGVTQNFVYVSAAPQVYVVPTGASYMNITCRGGTNRSITGGAAPGTIQNRTGATILASFDVIAGTRHDVFVPNTIASLNSAPTVGQYPGGGGAASSGLNVPFAGSGYAGVRAEGGVFADSLIVAGAPGGIGGGVNNSRRANSGNANGAVGGNAPSLTADGLTAALFPGFGGTQVAGGAAGVGGTAGSAGQGGAGSGLRFNAACEFPGGGGAGWFGGGGAGTTVATNTISGGGGAGSSYVNGTGTDITHTAGTDTGAVVNGSVSFTTFVLNGQIQVELHVIHAVPRDSNLIAADEIIANDRAYPFRGSVVTPLDDGDRIYLRIINNSSTNRYQNNQSWLSAVRSGI